MRRVTPAAHAVHHCTVLKGIPLLLGLAGALSACGPRPDAHPTAERPRPAAPDIELVADTTVVSAKVVAGATLASILQKHAVVASDVAALVQRAASVFDLRKVRAQQPYVLV